MFAKSLIETHSYLRAYHRTAETSWDIKCCVHYFYSYCVRWNKRTLCIPLVSRKLFVQRETDTTMHTCVLQLVKILSLLHYEPLITRCKNISSTCSPRKRPWSREFPSNEICFYEKYWCLVQLSSAGMLLFSRSLTPITPTHHKHLSSARFFAVSYPSHMLLINCSLFLPLVHFPVILPSRMSRKNTSCRRTCPSHLHFRWFIVLMIHLFPSTRFRTSELLTFDFWSCCAIYNLHISGIRSRITVRVHV